jgi:hypothetical protein
MTTDTLADAGQLSAGRWLIVVDNDDDDTVVSKGTCRVIGRSVRRRGS